MKYTDYFKPGQRVTLRITVNEATEEERFDSLFAIIANCHDSDLEIHFPPPFDHLADYPFARGQKIELLTDRFGMGVSAGGEFNRTLTETAGIIISFQGELSYFNRRRHKRADISTWLGIERCDGTIAFLKGRWQQLVDHFKGDDPSPHLADYARREISLSASGIGLFDTESAEIGSYTLIYLALPDSSDVSCILGEIVRSDQTEKDLFNIGIHFDCIEEEARQKIERFVNQLCKKSE